MNVSRSVLLLALASMAHGSHAAEAESVIPETTVFIEQAAQTSLTEIAAAKIALAKSQDPGIRDFAQRMVREHGDQNLELVTLATTQGIEAPMQIDAEHQAMLDAMTAKSGADFDRGYSEQMIKGHSRAVALFESATNSPDPAVSGYAKKTLPRLREHKALAGKLPGAVMRRDAGGGS